MLGGSLCAIWSTRTSGSDPGGALSGFASIAPYCRAISRNNWSPFYREIQDRLNAIPGVRDVSATTYAPMTDGQWSKDIRIQGKPEPGPKRR